MLIMANIQGTPSALKKPGKLTICNEGVLNAVFRASIKLTFNELTNNLSTKTKGKQIRQYLKRRRNLLWQIMFWENFPVAMNWFQNFQRDRVSQISKRQLNTFILRQTDLFILFCFWLEILSQYKIIWSHFVVAGDFNADSFNL